MQDSNRDFDVSVAFMRRGVSDLTGNVSNLTGDVSFSRLHAARCFGL